MVRYALQVQPDRCIGCYACEVACKQENDIPVGPRWIRVLAISPNETNGRPRLHFVPITCKHCVKPACKNVCPEDAIVKRKDGIVLIDAMLCTGCKACVDVCPYRALQFNPEKGVVEKCTLCVHRIDQSLKPSCVLSCPTKALHFGNMKKLSGNPRKRRPEKHHGLSGRRGRVSQNFFRSSVLSKL